MYCWTSPVMTLPSAFRLAIDAQTKDTGFPVSGLATRCRFQMTSSAVTGVPSCQVAPSRTTMRTRVLSSSAQPHSVSRPGRKLRSAFWSMYWSNTHL